VPLRAAAARLLGESPAGEDARALLDSLRAPAEAALVQAVLAAVLRHGDVADVAPGAALLDAGLWGSLQPVAQDLALAALLARPGGAAIVLDAVAAGTVPAAAVSGSLRKGLLAHADETLRCRAADLFGGAGGADRLEVYEAHKSVLAIDPVAENGRRVFARHCASCHRLDREGHAVGPDLFDVRNRTKEAILYHVLVPSAEVTPGFAGCEVVTRDGRVLSGIVAADSGGAVKLLQAHGVEETLPRGEIVSLARSAASLMPDGFEALMSRQELADLIAYVRGE
jgi:putative heme-binding domain-containing protein